MLAACRLLRYLRTTRDFGLLFPYARHHQHPGLHAFADSDWANDTVERRSTSGYIVLYNGTPIPWHSGMQSVIALSSCEAEYVSLCDCCRLPPPPAAWSGARAGLSSERSSRPLPASVRAASGTALVIFTAPLVVSAPAPTWPASAPSQAVQAAKVPWLGTTAAAGAKAPRTLQTCTLPPPLPTP
jgi:hypothetical protein